MRDGKTDNLLQCDRQFWPFAAAFRNLAGAQAEVPAKRLT
jgi:hypothetical protein